MNTKERNTGIDFLRIIAMIGVVFLHVLSQGGALDRAATISLRHYYRLKLLQTLGYCSVPMYAIISGYVGVGRKWKPSNLIYLIFTALFYTIGFSVLLYVFKSEEIGVVGMLKGMIPDYWYLMCYFEPI